MMLAAALGEAMAALRSNLVRSALTAIGVIIGVAGIVVLGSAGSGANHIIQRQIASLGANTLWVEAVKVENAVSRGPGVVLTDEDAAAILEQVPGIRRMSREVEGRATIVAGSARTTTDYRGIDLPYAGMVDVKTSKGRFLDEDEIRAGAKVAVLGTTVAAKLFPGASPIDQSIRINGVPVRVVGVRARQGSFLGRDRDDVVFVPLTTARTRLPKEGRVTASQVDSVHVKVASAASRAAAKEAILALLRERNHASGGPRNMFEVFDPTQYVELMNTTRSTLSTLLAATAAISLLVGGVGIMNIMLVSVTERTREIGLRMALGARRRDILVQFIVEALLLCMAAGVAGLAVGIAGSIVVARTSGWPLIVPAWLVVAALAAAVAIGVIFGYLPARRAAALEPVGALRCE